MRACGMSETVSGGVSVTYAPISAAFESVSLYANIDGLQQKLLGCRGSAALRFRNEEIPLVHFRLLSLYAVPTDTALPTLTLTAHQQPVPVNKTTLVTSSLHGYSFGFQEADVDVGNVFDYQSFPNGSEQVFITDRALERPRADGAPDDRAEGLLFARGQRGHGHALARLRSDGRQPLHHHGGADAPYQPAAQRGARHLDARARARARAVERRERRVLDRVHVGGEAVRTPVALGEGRAGTIS
jgi:hypothetical protein